MTAATKARTTKATPPPQSSGASGPAYATATPRQDPIPTASASGPTSAALRARWDAYSGKFSGPLAPLANQPDLNVIANRIGPEVRTGVDFLFGPVLKLEHPTSGAQDILDAVWGNEDQRMTKLSKLRINGGVYGHWFLKIVCPTNRKPMSAQNPPRLVVQNPELYSVVTEPDDCETVRQYRCQWQDTDADGNACERLQTTTRVDPDDGADETYSDGGADETGDDEHWEIQNWTRVGGAEGEWQPDGPVILWPYPFAPIVDRQNYPNPNDHWGAADVDDALISLNRALHLVESNTNAVQYSHGHPWLFNTGDGDTGGITPTPGSITDVPGGNIIAITASGDVGNMMAYAASIRADMDEASATPGVATGRMTELPRGALSGITVRLLYGPRIMRTEHERRLYGDGISEISRRVLVLCGQETAASEPVKLTWQDPLPQDDLAMAQMALALQQLGVSDHSIYALIGLNYETEQEYKQQEAKDQLTAYAQGQGMPPASAAPPANESGQPGQPAQPPAQQGNGGTGGNMPPVNHPAAIAARAAAKAAGQAMKGAK